MNHCEDCDVLAELSEYDDTMENADTGVYYKGYHHGWMLCQNCTTKFDYQTQMVYDEEAREHEYLRTSHE